MWRARIRVSLACLALLASACAGESKSPTTTPAAPANRLQGNWHLLSFSPSLALEQPLKGLLDAQLKTLTLSFTQGEFSASGPNVDTSGRYEITSAEGDLLSGRIYDRAGASYKIAGQFIGKQFRFFSEAPPWVGNGVLERAP